VRYGGIKRGLKSLSHCNACMKNEGGHIKYFFNFLGGCNLDITFQTAYVHITFFWYYGVFSTSVGLYVHFLVHILYMSLGWSVEIISFLVKTEKTSEGTKDQLNRRLNLVLFTASVLHTADIMYVLPSAKWNTYASLFTLKNS